MSDISFFLIAGEISFGFIISSLVILFIFKYFENKNGFMICAILLLIISNLYSLELLIIYYEGNTVIKQIGFFLLTFLDSGEKGAVLMLLHFLFINYSSNNLYENFSIKKTIIYIVIVFAFPFGLTLASLLCGFFESNDNNNNNKFGYFVFKYAFTMSIFLTSIIMVIRIVFNALRTKNWKINKMSIIYIFSFLLIEAMEIIIDLIIDILYNDNISFILKISNDNEKILFCVKSLSPILFSIIFCFLFKVPWLVLSSLQLIESKTISTEMEESITSLLNQSRETVKSSDFR